MSVDLIIRNARIVSPRASIPGSVVVKDGKIVEIVHDENLLPEAAETVDAKGKYLMPDAVDSS
jgi:dihydroorotase-like cyclic amidohydrolase